MTYVGYIVDSVNNKIALAHGKQEDMLVWKKNHSVNNPTAEVVLLPEGADLQRCFLDKEYFKSLI